MIWKMEWKKLSLMLIVFISLFYMPIGNSQFDNAILESLYLVKWYTQEHVILCLIPAFFIAGAISIFVAKDSIINYLGPKAKRIIAYGVSSISGCILAVCSCTVLPLFAGIYNRGAGIGPATTFLYSGPAINVLAILLTANVLGLELGIARGLGAIVFSIIIGIIMSLIFREEESKRLVDDSFENESKPNRPLWQTSIFFGLMILILVFANWSKPETQNNIWYSIYENKWWLTGIASIVMGVGLVLWYSMKWWQVLLLSIPVSVLAYIYPDIPLLAFGIGLIGLSVITTINKGELGEWFEASWTFAKQILPLLLIGVLIAGFLLGRPGSEGIVPSEWITNSVGDNSIISNLFASVVGAFMYFATLTEIPILQGLLGNGMAKGPALALLLSGPALSLPNMLVIKSVIGTKKTIAYILLVIIMSTITGYIYGNIF